MSGTNQECTKNKEDRVDPNNKLRHKGPKGSVANKRGKTRDDRVGGLLKGQIQWETPMRLEKSIEKQIIPEVTYLYDVESWVFL